MAVFNHEMLTERNLNRRLDFKKRRNIIFIAKYCGWELEDIRHQLDRGGIYVMTPEEWLELERERIETECDPDEIRQFLRAMGVHGWRLLFYIGAALFYRKKPSTHASTRFAHKCDG